MQNNTILFEKNNTTNKVKLGNKIYIADPCYDLTSNGIQQLEIKPGVYECYADYTECWGRRVAKTTLIHEDYTLESLYRLNERLLPNEIYVDSGQAGVFDATAYETIKNDDLLNERFYELCCDITLDDSGAGIIEDVGFVSETGFGDGAYNAFGYYDANNLCVAIEVEFINEEEEED